MVKVQTFSDGLEASRARIGAELAARRSAHEVQNLPERERVSEVIRASVRTVEAPAAPPVPAPTVPAATLPAANIPEYLTGDGADPVARQEVEALVALAFRDGISAAAAKAAKANPFVQDAFHDALVDRVIPELKKRNLL